jgi:hypothetical protein
LPLAITSQGLEEIAGQGGKVVERCSRIQPVELQPSRAFDAFECLNAHPGSEIPRSLVSIADYHASVYFLLRVTSKVIF